MNSLYEKLPRRGTKKRKLYDFLLRADDGVTWTQALDFYMQLEPRIYVLGSAESYRMKRKWAGMTITHHLHNLCRRGPSKKWFAAPERFEIEKSDIWNVLIHRFSTE